MPTPPPTPSGHRFPAALALGVAALLLALPVPLWAQERLPRGGGGNELAASLFFTDVPQHALDVVAGRPTDHAVTLSLLAYAPRRVVVHYGTSAQTLAAHTADLDLSAGKPKAIELADLAPNAPFFFEVRTADAENTLLQRGQFHTQRSAGAGFTFTVTADSHLDFNTRTDVYERTLNNIVADRPDLHFDLGDTFMTEKYNVFAESQAQYLAQRYWFGLVSTVAPVFLTLGNHDGEAGFVPQQQKRGMALWSAQMRTAYFPNPEPNAFYSGNNQPMQGVGTLQDYYAFEWGDAQFIVLDPFWPTEARGGRDASGWDMTLGAAQYEWLVKQLQTSRAQFRFVFIHHLIGGGGTERRGGIESAPFFEWGGRDANGRDQFAQRRPGWAMPIHALMVKYGVNVVFHGHDHLFAHQELDGVVYQEVPQPSHAENRVQAMATEYGYLHGDILPSPGHMRVTIDSGVATVDYVRSYLPAEVRQGRVNGRMDLSYQLRPRT